MNESLTLFLLTHEQVILFFSHVIIFTGGFYVAMHSRIMPKWLITCLWYIGLSSLFTVITLLIEWIGGPYEPLSYSSVRILSQFLPLLSIAVTLLLLFINTLCSDIACRKLRKSLFKDKKL